MPALLPWFEVGAIDLGFARLSTFGTFWFLGAGLGVTAAVAAARRRGLEPGRAVGMALFALAAGSLGAHAASVFLYRPEVLAERPLAAVLELSNGLSSMGGLVVGLGAGWVWARLARRPGPAVLDALAVGAAVGFAVGRVGCALVHDHPGRASTFALAVDHPAGPRHDLGLYELGVFAILALLLARALPRARRGLLAAGFALLYAGSRFLLDFLRIAAAEAEPLIAAGLLAPETVDPRWLALTPAQWLAIPLAASGLVLLRAERAA